MENFFYVAYNGGCFMGAISKDERVVKPLRFALANAASRLPDCIPILFQTSLFSGDSGGNSVELQVRGENLDEVTAAASELFGACMQKFGFPGPDPVNFNRGRAEFRAIPDRVKAAELGLSVRDIGFMLRACVDGAYVGGFREHGDEIDLSILVEGTEGATKEQLASVPICARGGALVPLGSATTFEYTSAPQQINHIEKMPAVTLTIRPPEGLALAQVMASLESDVIAPLREKGHIPPSVITALAGNADKLVQTRTALFGELKAPWTVLTSRGFLALLVTYLLMAALFESFAYPFVIMFSVPLATVGGFLGLRIVHALSLRDPVAPIQQLDVVTMLGFVILIGVVVRNAILIVHQALNNIRDYGMTPHNAVTESVRTRIRPIFMTALTSVFGMLPLVVAPGSGSELYRGLGAVMVGGLIVATVFTLVLVPAMFSLFVSTRDALAALVRRRIPASQTIVATAPRSAPVIPAPEIGTSSALPASISRSPEP
jgi:HAE1 family hydrophobic/amphiphilic exporter-1